MKHLKLQEGHDMKPHIMRLFVLLILTCSVAIPRTQGQQAAQDRLQQAIHAMGATNLETLRYSGSGSGYTYDLDAEGEETREYERIASWVQEIDYAGLSSQVEVTRQVGTGEDERVEHRAIGPDAPWESQLDLWLDPQMFLKQAAAATNVRTEVETELGVDLTVVTFEAPGGHELSGYIDPDNHLKRIRTRLNDPVLGERTVEASFLYYEDFDGIQFPGVVIRKQNESLTRVLVVKEVSHEDAAA